MALTMQQSCLSHCTTSRAPLTAPTLPRRAVLQILQPPNYSQQRFSICTRASANSEVTGSENRSTDETGQAAPLVFKDESTGVVCYYDENGDVTCEGWDEGPHFQPDPQQPTLRRRRRFTPISVQGRSENVETVNFENVKGRMGESLGEVANESLESSEL